LFAGSKAAADPDIPDECLHQIATEVEKQVLLLERARQTALKRVAALQEEKDTLQARVADLAAKRPAVRQRYLQRKTAQFDDQSRKSDETIGLENDIDCTIDLMRQEIEALSDEVRYLDDAFGHLDGIHEEDDEVESQPGPEKMAPEPADEPHVEEEEEEEDNGEGA
jgi:recombination DNA repair RAD52 pathway protein